MKKREKPCKYCGKPFISSNDNRNYCKECSEKFDKSYLSRLRKRYYRLAEKIGFNPIGMPLVDIEKRLTSTCKHCGKPFVIRSIGDEECLDNYGRKLRTMDKIKKQNEEKKSIVIVEKRRFEPPRYSINDVVTRANAAGLSYGEYVARFNI